MRPRRPGLNALLVGAVLVALSYAGALAAAPGSAGAAGQVAISVSPARLVLAGSDRQTLQVVNSGRATARLDLGVGNYTIDRNGRVQVDPRLEPGRSAKDWLTVSPRTLVLAPGARRAVLVRSRPSRNARPGDHHALVLLSGLVDRNAKVRVRVRVGVQALVRVGGPLTRRLRVGTITLRRGARKIRLRVRNDGNVTEHFTSREAVVELLRGRRVVARLRPQERTLLPGTGGYILFRYGGRLHGSLTAVARLRPPPIVGVRTTPAARTRTRRLVL